MAFVAMNYGKMFGHRTSSMHIWCLKRWHSAKNEREYIPKTDLNHRIQTRPSEPSNY